MEKLRDLLFKRVLLFDGAMGTEIQKVDIKNEFWEEKSGCSEILNATAPFVISKIHRGFLEAGVDILKTNTFGSLPWVLDEYGIGDRAQELAYLGAKIAKETISSLGVNAFVGGSLGPGTKLPSLGHISYDELYDGYKIAAFGLIEGGADLFLIETSQDPLQIKAALHACQDAILEKSVDIPISVSATIETNGSMLIGTEVDVLATILEPFDIFSIGINCGLGPKEARKFLLRLSQCTSKPISIHANAGLPQNRGGCTFYPMEPEEFADLESRFLEIDGVALLGGCCGTTPEHLSALKRKVEGVIPKKPNGIQEPSIASLFQSVPLFQNPAPLLIGERSNATGSKAFRELLLKEDYEGVLFVAQAQVKKLAHLLDVSVAFAGRDEIKDMERTVALYSQKIPIPLMPDSTNPDALEVALKQIGGKAIINSANFEDGNEKFDRVCALAKRYGAAIVCLSIDEQGMAKSRKRKIEIVKRMHHRATTVHGLSESDIIFDVLTFTIASGDEEYFLAGVETIEAIRELKSIYPKCGSTLGISNISFGLDKNARIFLNSIFLHHCVEAGLSSAIVNTAHLLPYSKIEGEDIRICEDLIFNRSKSQKPLFDFIEHFRDKSADIASEDSLLENLSTEEKIELFLIDGQKDKMLELLEVAKDSINPEKIVNEILMGAMKIVGERFGNGDMQLPFVLQSAEVMKASVDYLNRYLPKKSKSSSSTLVLGTVKGDVHDVGKNLVDIILSNNGFKVVNIGIKADISDFIKAYRENSADAIGMSGLLVKSTMVMKENLEELKREGIECPILLGGAALNRKFIDEHCRSVYDGAIFYCRDAFDGIKAMGKIEKNEIDLDSLERETKEQSSNEEEEIEGSLGSVIYPAIEEPKVAPFLGRRVFKLDDKELAFKWLNMGMLIKTRWGYQKKKLSKEEYSKLKEETIYPAFYRLKDKFLNSDLFSPVVLYGYFKCRSRDNKLIVFDEGKEHILEFPRQKKEPRRALSDYFRSDVDDIVGFSLVSAGLNLAPFEKSLYDLGEFHEYFLVHGLGVELAEALAEIIHKQFRIDLGILGDEKSALDDVRMQKYIGCRYSFGYPACPDLEQNRVVFDLLKPEEFGISLSETFQIDPEASTCALITAHKEAKYFQV